ncbi:MAG TPA: hypothetical protein PKG52_06205 [bacterium]|nr:hypothetical protein [bacterium]HPS28620.1 hypothetical protein [bacterium]
MIRQLSVALFVMLISVSCKPGIDVAYTNWSDLDIAQNAPDEDADFDNAGDEDFDEIIDGNDEPADSDETDNDIDDVPDTDGTIKKSCENSTCSGGFCFENGGVPECFCPFGFHDEFPDCVENKEGSVCDGVTCSGYGDCFDAGGLLTDPVCQCDDSYIPINLTCLKDLSGDPCDYIDCGPNSECVIAIDTSLFECVCQDSFIEDESGWGCVEDIPDPCESKNCGDHGTCEAVDGKAVCKCDDGYFYNGTACIKESEKTCSDIDCSGHGDCLQIEDKFYCKCDQGYYASGLECLKDTAVQCNDDFDCYYQCGMFNGKCIDSKCECG